MGILYVHYFPNGKVYVGITTRATAEKRWGENGKYYEGQLVYNAILKYGWDNIKHKIISDKIDNRVLGVCERFLISVYDSTNRDFGYNISDGGETGNHYAGKSEKEMEDIRKRLGEIRTEVWEKKTEEEKNKEKIKQRNSHGGDAIVQLSIQGNLIREFISLHEVEDITGINRKSVSDCCKGKTGSKTAGGYLWLYRRDYLKMSNEDTQKRIKSLYKSSKNKEVVQLSVDGKFINKFNGCRDAEKQTHINHSNISACCSHKGYVCVKGYIWMFFDEYDAITKKEMDQIVAKAKNERHDIRDVVQLSLDGTLIKRYNNCKEASICTGAPHGSINKCCNGKVRTAGGFVWKYAEKFN